LKLREGLPEFSPNLQWLNERVTREQLIGKLPILVHFWSVSCHSCKGAIPIMNYWNEKYNGKLNIVSVHMPRTIQDVDVQMIQTISQQLNIQHPICLDHHLEVTKTYQNRFVPSYFLFDKKGLLRHYQSGENGMRMLENKLIRMMNE
jgi:thiol-disulfide isomerase/thioredoxin